MRLVITVGWKINKLRDNAILRVTVMFLNLYLYLCLAYIVLPFQHRDRIYTSESDVCGRRQTLTYKDVPRTERIKIFMMTTDP